MINNNKKLEMKSVLAFMKENNGKATKDQIKMLFKDKDIFEIADLIEFMEGQGLIFENIANNYRLMGE